LSIHEAQLLTYLKLARKRVGLLINFNVIHLEDGIRRRVCGAKRRPAAKRRLTAGVAGSGDAETSDTPFVPVSSVVKAFPW
jgi:hypothetical protein